MTTCGRLAGYSRGLPSLAAVSRRSDYEDSGGLDAGDHGVEERVPDLRPEAEVDDAGAEAHRGIEPLDDVAGSDSGPAGARVPGVEVGLRIDADDSDVVQRRGSDRRDGGAVLLEVPRGALRVQRRRRRTTRELLVRQVDARVDDRQRLARAWRSRAVRADVGDPPVRPFRRRWRRGHRQQRLVGRDDGDEVRSDQPWKNAERLAAWHPPDRQGVRQLHAARLPQRRPGSGPSEHEPRVVQSKLAAPERAKARMPRPTPAPRKARGPRRRERPRDASRQRT